MMSSRRAATVSFVAASVAAIIFAALSFSHLFSGSQHGTNEDDDCEPDMEYAASSLTPAGAYRLSGPLCSTSFRLRLRSHAARRLRSARRIDRFASPDPPMTLNLNREMNRWS